MTVDTAAVPAEAATEVAPADVLSADELLHLTLFKWRYSLEACGFEDDEVSQLVFLKWLYSSERVAS